MTATHPGAVAGPRPAASIPGSLGWPQGTTVTQLPGGRWSAWLSPATLRFSHEDIAIVHEMITRAAGAG